VERAVEDLINVVLSFPMEDSGGAQISDDTIQKLRDHYSRLMYHPNAYPQNPKPETRTPKR